MGFETCLLRDRARDCWEEVGHALGAEVAVANTWKDFVTKFRSKFVMAIEV